MRVEAGMAPAVARSAPEPTARFLGAIGDERMFFTLDEVVARHLATQPAA